jgi:hypothetical protein
LRDDGGVHLRRKTEPPADLVGKLHLHPGERLLAWAKGFDGEWYLGSDLALHLPDAAGGPRRLGWEQIERADWQRDSDQLAIVEVTQWGEPAPTTVVRIDEPGHLLELLRERVTKSVVCSVYSRVRGSAGLNIVGRRSPSGKGTVVWSYVLSPGLDPNDPDVVRVAEVTLEQAQRELEGL